MVDVFSKQDKIQKVLIFGSRAIGNFYEGSDIDLAIFTDENFDREDYNKMYREIDDIGLLYQIDFIIYNKLKHENLKSHINRVGKVFYSLN